MLRCDLNIEEGASAGDLPGLTRTGVCIIVCKSDLLLSKRASKLVLSDLRIPFERSVLETELRAAGVRVTIGQDVHSVALLSSGASIINYHYVWLTRGPYLLYSDSAKQALR